MRALFFNIVVLLLVGVGVSAENGAVTDGTANSVYRFDAYKGQHDRLRYDTIWNVRPGTWIDCLLSVTDMRLKFPHLVLNFSKRELDSLMEAYEAIYIDAHGGLDSLAGNCHPKPIKDYPEEVNTLCDIIYGDLMMVVTGYGHTYCLNRMLIFDWYRKYGANINADEYKWLELLSCIPQSSTKKMGQMYINLGIEEHHRDMWEAYVFYRKSDVKS